MVSTVWLRIWPNRRCGRTRCLSKRLKTHYGTIRIDYVFIGALRLVEAVRGQTLTRVHDRYQTEAGGEVASVGSIQLPLASCPPTNAHSNPQSSE